MNLRRILFMGLAVAFGSSAFAQNLVTNGNFATGNLTGWTLQAASSGTDQFVSSSPAGDPGGSTFSWFEEAVGGIDDVISQTFATTAGRSYTYSLNIDNEVASGSLQDVWWNTGTFTTGGGNVYSQANPATGWQTLSFQVTATGGSTTIGIGGFNGPSGIAVSDVSVTANAVPEPASLAVLGLGALALIRRRRCGK